MTQRDIDHWDKRYRSGDGPKGRRADNRLEPFSAYLDMLKAERATGQNAETNYIPGALDVACGAGGTMLWLARRGWQVSGVDASEEALRLAAEAISAADLDEQCRLIAADLDSWRPEASRYDLVTCFFFLDRTLMPALRESIKPGGLLIIETFNRHWSARRPQANPAFLLEEGELFQIATGWGWQVLQSDSNGPEVDRPTDSIVARRPLVR